MITRKSRLLLAMLVAMLAVSASPVIAWGHGYSTDPTSRAVWCQKNRVGDCGGVQWEPQSIEGPKGFPRSGPPDGRICSAGNPKWKALDGTSAPNGSPWPFTTLHADTEYTYVWYLTAPHRTTHFKVWITSASWKPGDPVTRAAFEPDPIAVDEWGGNKPGRDVEFTATLPDRNGAALLLLTWDVDDTANAFYQCADVEFV